MHRAEIVAFIGSVTSRRHVRADTLEGLRRTDWGAEPTVVLDQARYDDPGMRSTDTAREALERAAQRDDWDVVLFLEDDVDCNRHLRHNLEHCAPIRALEPGGHLCASLYDPGVGSLDPAQDAPTYRIVDPQHTYGSQAVLFSRTTLNHVLDGYRDHIGLGDIRMFHLAARLGPIHYHRPSLVQHRPVPSHWGGVAHAAADFDPTFRADPIP